MLSLEEFHGLEPSGTGGPACAGLAGVVAAAAAAAGRVRVGVAEGVAAALLGGGGAEGAGRRLVLVRVSGLPGERRL